MIRNLVIGASGLVGSHLVKSLISAGQEVNATYHNHPIPSAMHLDIRDQTELEKVFATLKPKVVYLPGAIPNVDYCETHQEETYETNVKGVQNVVNAVNRAGAKLVYFSSDYIFDGVSGPYKETDLARPISEYGRQKLAAEHYTALHAQEYLIVRTTVIYGWESQGKNFVYRLIKSLQEGSEIKVPVDQIGSPTYANNLTEIVTELSPSASGVLHIAGTDVISRYEFALTAARIFKLDQKLIQPVKTETLNQPAKRPLNAGLIVNKAASISKISLTDHRNGLTDMKASRTLYKDLFQQEK